MSVIPTDQPMLRQANTSVSSPETGKADNSALEKEFVFQRRGFKETLGAQAQSIGGTVWEFFTGKTPGSPDGVIRRRQSDGSELVTQPVRDSADVLRVFGKLLKHLDVDKDGYLNREKLDQAILDRSLTGEDAQVLVAIYSHFERFATLSQDGRGTADLITRADIERFDQIQKRVNLGVESNPQWGDLVQSVNNSLRQTRQIVQDSPRTLYADMAKPLASVKPQAVVQSGLGNCYFYAALACMAVNQPQTLVKMIEDNHDGTFRVTFPGKKPISVPAPTDAELALYPKPGQFGIWVTILEKAYGLYCMDDPLYRAWRSLQGMRPSAIPQEHTDGGSAFDSGLRILSGKKVGWLFSFQGLEALHNQLQESLNPANGKPPQAVTADCAFNISGEKDGPVTLHVYSVLAYDARERRLIMRNPWGHSIPAAKGIVDLGDGTFSMSLDLFMKQFTKISYVRE